MKAIEILKKRLSKRNTLIIQNERGNISEAGFIWNDPATIEEIIKFEYINHIILPEEYKDFLQISNGAILYKDIEYGQWGCKILGLTEIITVTNRMKEYRKALKNSYIAFAEWLGDGDILLFDLEKLASEKRNYILDGDEGYEVESWDYIKGDFGRWLDRLIVAQGAKYWRWF